VGVILQIEGLSLARAAPFTRGARWISAAWAEAADGIEEPWPGGAKHSGAWLHTVDRFREGSGLIFMRGSYPSD